MKPHYAMLVNDLSDVSLTVFDALAEVVMPEGSNELIEANKWYRAADIKRAINMEVPSACFIALVNRGLLEDDRDKKGKLYCITDEMYDLIETVYWPSKDKYIYGRGGNWG